MTTAIEIVDALLESDDPGSDMDLDKFVRDAGVAVNPDDFIMDGTQDRFGRWPTGNYTYSIYYKRLLYKGKPVYLGSVSATHDYNTTGHSGHVHFWANPPRTTKDHFPINKRTGQRYKRARQRSYYGYGAVRMNPPSEQDSRSFSSLFDAAKYLLSLLKRQHPLRQA